MARSYWNLMLVADDIKECWQQLEPFFRGRHLSSSCSTIVVAEGAHGWDDYLLLFHSDRRERVDHPV